MLKSYITIALRNIMRYKVFSLINIISLSIGIAFALFISLWVKDEFRFNQFHENLSDLYYVHTNVNWGSLQTWTNTPGPLADRLRSDFPEVHSVVRLASDEEMLLQVDQKNRKSKGLFVDPEFLSMFSFELLEGDAQTALNDPNSIVLTQKLAAQLFGHQDPIGQYVSMKTFEAELVFTVRGIVKDVPFHSEIQFNWLAPWDAWAAGKDWVKTWGNVAFRTYVQMMPDASFEVLDQKLRGMEKAEEHGLEFFLQPLSETYLYSKFTAGKQDGGRIEYVRLFSAIATFLLVMACINFMNLATARSSRRAKEIGIRKTVGASRPALTFQFMGEAILLSAISTGLGLVMVQFSLDWFNHLFAKEIAINFSDPGLLVAIFALIIVSGLLAGSYPAFLLSSFKPVNTLKGDQIQLADRSAILRKGLVVFQFCLSIFIIIATVVIHLQVHYIKNKNLGIDREDLFYTQMEGELYSNQSTYHQALLESPAIKSVTFTQSNPMNMGGSSGDLSWPGKAADETVLVAPMTVSEGFTKTFGVEMKEGRDFSAAIPGDTSNYIVNETLVKAIGLEDPVGSPIEFWMGKGQIIGVVSDYHLQSLHIPIRPMILTYFPLNTSMVWIKPFPGKVEDAIAHVEEISEKLNPSYPFEFHFADEAFEQQYKNETLIGKLANVFTVLSLIVSCLGLLGLSIYAAERRRKEIGIRKVLGASVASIVTLLSSEFVKLTFVAILIATPLSWYLAERWLQNFAYSVDIHFNLFVLAAFSVVLITLFTVSFQSIKAALSNPVNALKDD